MLKISTRELIICIITIMALIFVLATDAFATTPSLNELLNDATANEFNTIPEGNKIANNTVNNVVNNTTNRLTNNTVNTIANNNVKGNNTVIPDAGLDQSIVFIIAIFGISAVYAYKKIRDYKNV